MARPSRAGLRTMALSSQSESESACTCLDQPVRPQGSELPHTSQSCSTEQLNASAWQA